MPPAGEPGPADEPGEISPAPTDSSDPADPPPAGPDRVQPPSLPVTLSTVGQIIEDGRAAGDVRPDVAEDLVNLITNLERDLENGSTNLPAATALLRDKVETREQEEGALGPATASELHAALDELAT